MTREALEGKAALVTGGARRIGRAIALALAREGAHVVVHHRAESEGEGSAVVAEARNCGVRAWQIAADFRRPNETRRLVPEAAKLAGGLDILVNNAGVFPPSRLADLSLDALYETLSINAVAPLLLAQAFAKQTERGAIVNILDRRVSGFDREHAGYQLSKNMLRDLTRMMALEFAPGIRVNAVAPGPILPPPGADPEHLRRETDRTLLDRGGDVSDVAEAVLYLVRGAFVTGEILFVDGGRALRRSDDA
jgi:NAD(P)-dependent dehydrogenase (short-subunit alcohol dehydrogenase family)